MIRLGLTVLALLTLLPALRAAEGTNGLARLKNPAHITAASTYYDRKEGMVIFSGRVFVDDQDYKLHADKAFLFLSETNDLKRIVATGHIALTNGTKRAYGGKATFRRDTGLVVLHAGDGGVAEVRDAAEDGDRIVRGRKIRLWINQEQVEVLEADISVPTGAAGAAVPGLDLGGVGK